ncbi:MAG: PLDc N-terminal domain-containing protein [Clostridia bacterium]|nr:PLDc N-terminal domain-containing protein [Clostridia bacterium]
MSLKKDNFIKHSKRGLKGLVFSRLGIILLLFLLQIVFLFFSFYVFEGFLPQIWGGNALLVVIAVFYIINCQMNPSAKITWLVLIMALPVFGCLLFGYTRSEIGHRALRERYNFLARRNRTYITGSDGTQETLEKRDKGIYRLSTYLASRGANPAFENTETVYLSSGEAKLELLLQELEKAERFIFLEYFIIAEGEMWGQVLEILKRKVKEGVEVRVLYDGTCEFTKLPHSYPTALRKMGIKCKMFSPITPFLSTHYNYRDHRKILVIDGKVAFNGGINLADEYINVGSRFGHWKDSALMLRGEAVKSFTLMFLHMWELDAKAEDYTSYLISEKREGEGFVIPYSDCPVDNDKIGHRVYMDILNRAASYVHIMTPYLILDPEMETALKFAAERGVEVNIILPGIPDKKGAWSLAKTHYKSLLLSGVNIYEYTPGFIHSKVFISDSREGVVGTINLDYRSLYHHFECATYMAYTPCLREMEEDFSATLEKCRRVTLSTIKKERLIVKIRGRILKIIAPLM